MTERNTIAQPVSRALLHEAKSVLATYQAGRQDPQTPSKPQKTGHLKASPMASVRASGAGRASRSLNATVPVRPTAVPSSVGTLNSQWRIRNKCCEVTSSAPW